VPLCGSDDRPRSHVPPTRARVTAESLPRFETWKPRIPAREIPYARNSPTDPASSTCRPTRRMNWCTFRRTNRVAVEGFRLWKGRGPSAVDSAPPGAPPKYPDPGQQGNDLAESQGDRIWSGAGFLPCGFPNPPTTFLNFSLWRVFICLAHFGWPLWPLALGLMRGLLKVGRPSPSPFNATNCSLHYDFPLGLAVILSSRWGKPGLWVHFRGSSFD